MDDDKRIAPRHRTLKGARIVINDGFSTFQCTVRNLSAYVARAEARPAYQRAYAAQLAQATGQAPFG